MIAQVDLPKEDFFEERTFQLKHADPDQLKTIIEELYSETSGTTSTQQLLTGRGGTGRTSSTSSATGNPEDLVRVISYAMRKQITVIASPQNMERITKQIEEEWDRPLDIELDQYRIITLSNSDPVKMADLLKTLFSQEGATSSSGSTSTRNLQQMLGASSTSTATDRQKIIGSLFGMVTFEPVPDTKKLLVISQIPEAYEVVKRLIEKLDARDEADVPTVITLNYADPEALSDQLNAILNPDGSTATIQRSVRGLSAYSTGTSQAVSTSEEGSGTITPWWTRQQQDTTRMPVSNLLGRIRFIPVHRSKAILVLAPPEYLEDVRALIADLDRPGMQVMIKVVIMEINLTDMSSLGLQISSGGLPYALSAFSTLEYLGPEAVPGIMLLLWKVT